MRASFLTKHHNYIFTAQPKHWSNCAGTDTFHQIGNALADFPAAVFCGEWLPLAQPKNIANLKVAIILAKLECLSTFQYWAKKFRTAFQIVDFFFVLFFTRASKGTGPRCPRSLALVGTATPI